MHKWYANLKIAEILELNWHLILSSVLKWTQLWIPSSKWAMKSLCEEKYVMLTSRQGFIKSSAHLEQMRLNSFKINYKACCQNKSSVSDLIWQL